MNEQNLPTTIDFRKNEPQIVRLFGGVETVTFLGLCPLTNVRLYESTGSNDPRGIMDKHAADTLVAAEYGYAGPDVIVQWLLTNDRDGYERAIAYAKSAHWWKAEGDSVIASDCKVK